MDRTETYPEVGGEESGLVPPQGHKGEWPKKIRTLTAVELDRLTIDGDGRFYWDGRLVNYEAQRQEARPADLDALAILDRAAVELSGQPQGAGDPQAYGDAPAVEQHAPERGWARPSRSRIAGSEKPRAVARRMKVRISASWPR